MQTRYVEYLAFPMSARPCTLTEHVIESLIAAISSGQYPMGTKLPAGIMNLDGGSWPRSGGRPRAGRGNRGHMKKTQVKPALACAFVAPCVEPATPAPPQKQIACRLELVAQAQRNVLLRAAVRPCKTV